MINKLFVLSAYI